MPSRFITLILIFSVSLLAFACGAPKNEEPAPVQGKSYEEIQSEVFGTVADFDKEILAGKTEELGYKPPAERPVFGATATYPHPDVSNANFKPSATDPLTGADWKDLHAVITTTKGDIEIEFYHDVAPRHVENFVWLVRDGFYDGLKWHRYVAGFVIQGGDPKGTGEGGPGYTVPAEFSDKQHVLGAVAAARLGDEVNPKKESSGSQFYICLDDVHHLDNEYTVFGNVVRGMDVVDKLRQTDYMEKIVIVNVNDIAAGEPSAPAEPAEEIVIGE